MALLEQGRDNHAMPVTMAAGAPGGVLYSLEVVDQARVLAVGFHNLVHWALQHELRLFFLEFPRLVADPQYTVDTLWPWLSAHCGREMALRRFQELADPEAVRINHRAEDDRREPADRDALARAATLDYVAELRQAVDELRAESDTLRARAERADALATDAETVRRGLHDAERERAATAQRVEALSGELELVRGQLAEVMGTRSWRWLEPLRMLRRTLTPR